MGIIRRFIDNYQRRESILQERGVFSYIRNSSGYVLIMVLILTTLLVALSSDFIVVAQTNAGYIRKLNNRLKANYFARSGIEVAKFLLYADTRGLSSEMLTGKKTDKSIDSYYDIWAVKYPPIPLDTLGLDEEGYLKIDIEDENSKINLSVLANEYTEQTKFYYMTINFFMNMGLPIDLADIIHDWVDIDDSRMPYGAETSDYYSTLTPAYTAKNSAMDSIDELLLCKDITPEIFYGRGGGNYQAERESQTVVDDNKGTVEIDDDKLGELTGMSKREVEQAIEERGEIELKIGKEKSRKLSDYFTVYGERNDYTSEFNRININTASYRVLSALTDTITPDIVAEIINRRIAEPFKSVDEIADLIDDQTIRDRLGVKSSIFKINCTSVVGNAKVTITTIYNRSTRKIMYWCEE